MQHALRAFTPDDEKALRAAARTFPKTAFYDVQRTLTTLGTGEALVTVLRSNGTPTEPFATRILPPASRMGPLTEPEMMVRLAASDQVRSYSKVVDSESAHEKLSERMHAAAAAVAEAAASAPAASSSRSGSKKEPPTNLDKVLKSPLARSFVTVVTRGLMGAILGPPRRRR